MLGFKEMTVRKARNRTVAGGQVRSGGGWDHRGSSGRNQKWPGSALISKVELKDFIIIGCRWQERKMSPKGSKQAALKRKTILTHAATWVNLMLSEISQ